MFQYPSWIEGLENIALSGNSTGFVVVSVSELDRGVGKHWRTHPSSSFASACFSIRVGSRGWKTTSLLVRHILTALFQYPSWIEGLENLIHPVLRVVEHPFQYPSWIEGLENSGVNYCFICVLIFVSVSELDRGVGKRQRVFCHLDKPEFQYPSWIEGLENVV